MASRYKLEPKSSSPSLLQATEQEDISIVMPVFNHEDTVAEALESALMQEMPYTSVIYCLNDASTDKSVEVLNEYAEEYPGKIKVFTSTENLGSAKKSIFHHKPPVKGRYWCLLEGDDYWVRRDKLEKQITFLDNCHSSYVGCSCNTLLRNEISGKDSVIKPDRNSWNLWDLITLTKSYSFYVHTSSLIWRNIYKDRDSFLPPTFTEEGADSDVMLMHMMLYKGGKIHNIQEVMSCYRITGRGVWTEKSAKEQTLANQQLMDVLRHSIPFKYKVLVFLRNLKRRLL